MCSKTIMILAGAIVVAEAAVVALEESAPPQLLVRGDLVAALVRPQVAARLCTRPALLPAEEICSSGKKSAVARRCSVLMVESFSRP